MNPGTKVTIIYKGVSRTGTVSEEHGQVVRVSFWDGKRFQMLPMRASDCKVAEVVDDEE